MDLFGTKTIVSFTGEYFFLSNFFPVKILIQNKVYPSVEHYYQSQKTADPQQQESIRLAKSPNIAKSLGRKICLRTDWSSKKLQVMRIGLKAKFSQNQDLLEKLRNTGPTCGTPTKSGICEKCNSGIFCPQCGRHKTNGRKPGEQKICVEYYLDFMIVYCDEFAIKVPRILTRLSPDRPVLLEAGLITS